MDRTALSRPSLRRLTAAAALVSVALAPIVAASPASAAGPIATASSSGPLGLTSTGCVESFDGLVNGNGASALPPGAMFHEDGNNSDATYFAIDGSSNAGDTKSLGSTGSTDRAFGTLRSGNLIPTLGLTVRNDTGVTMTSLTVRYTLEQWRQGGANRFDRFDFSYSTTATSLVSGTYTDVNALDAVAPDGDSTTGAKVGSDGANQVVVTDTITGLSVASGASMILRWSDLDAAGADDALGIDDLVLAPNGAALSSTACPAGSGGGGDPTLTPIHDVQGSGATSPIAGTSPTIEGIVVGLDDLIGSSFGTGNAINTFPSDRGFFVQEEDADADASTATSEGIFIGVTSASTALPAIGDKVRVTGVVRDGQSAPAFGQTRMETSTFTVVSNGNALPTLTVIDAPTANAQTIGAETNPTRTYYETLEGMRVKLAVGVAHSGGTNKFGELFLVPGTATGTLLRTDPAEPGLIGTAQDAGAGNPPNPYDPAAPSSTYVAGDKNDTVTDLVGPLAYSYGNYKVMPQVGVMPTVTKTGVAFPYTGLAPAGAGDRRIASFNLENFFPVGGALDGHIIDAAEFAEKRDGAANAIGQLLHSPDVIAVQEIGDNQHLGQSGTTTSLGTLQSLATRLGELGYGSYTAYVVEGNDNRGIDNGFLVKNTVTVLAGPDQMGGLTAAGSCSDVSGRLFDRPPLFLQVDLGAGIAPLWLVSNHFSSKSAPDACRVAQATWLRDKVDTLEAGGADVIVAGDLNAFEDEGALSTLQDGTTTLDNLWDTVPYGEAYSFQFNGLLQTLDHLLVTAGVAPNIAGFQYAHLDNDYFLRSASEGHKGSDHDPPVLTLRAGGPAPVIPEAPVPWLLAASGGIALFAAAVVLGRGRRPAVSPVAG